MITSLGKYEILEEIGRGGFGVVYKARDTLLNRVVALKVLKPLLISDPAFMARFQQEAQTAAALEHPNIATIYELGEQEGRHYIAMKYLEGESLAKIIATLGSLTLARANHILQQVALALDYAHSKGLIHRDVKPSNIIVGEYDHATLTDFGLVKASSDSGISSSGQVIGSPQYMSPEQAESKPVDSRSDIYSLGIVLFEMLTGQVPFKADSTPSLLYKQVHLLPPRLASLRKDLPHTVESIMAKALAKQPDQRYQKAADLQADFANAIVPYVKKVKPKPAPPPVPTQTLVPPAAPSAPIPALTTSTPSRGGGPAPKKKPRKLPRVFLLGCFGIALAICGCVMLYSLYLVSPAGRVEAAAQAFMTALKNDNFAQAYLLCGSALQQELGSSDGMRQLIMRGRVQPTSWSFSSRSTNTDTAQLDGTVSFVGGRQGKVRIVLSLVSSEWKIIGFNLQEQ